MTHEEVLELVKETRLQPIPISALKLFARDAGNGCVIYPFESVEGFELNMSQCVLPVDKDLQLAPLKEDDKKERYEFEKEISTNFSESGQPHWVLKNYKRWYRNIFRHNEKFFKVIIKGGKGLNIVFDNEHKNFYILPIFHSNKKAIETIRNGILGGEIFYAEILSKDYDWWFEFCCLTHEGFNSLRYDFQKTVMVNTIRHVSGYDFIIRLVKDYDRRHQLRNKYKESMCEQILKADGLALLHEEAMMQNFTVVNELGNMDEEREAKEREIREAGIKLIKEMFDKLFD